MLCVFFFFLFLLCEEKVLMWVFGKKWIRLRHSKSR